MTVPFHHLGVVPGKRARVPLPCGIGVLLISPGIWLFGYGARESKFDRLMIYFIPSPFHTRDDMREYDYQSEEFFGDQDTMVEIRSSIKASTRHFISSTFPIFTRHTILRTPVTETL